MTGKGGRGLASDIQGWFDSIYPLFGDEMRGDNNTVVETGLDSSDISSKIFMGFTSPGYHSA